MPVRCHLLQGDPHLTQRVTEKALGYHHSALGTEQRVDQIPIPLARSGERVLAPGP